MIISSYFSIPLDSWKERAKSLRLSSSSVAKQYGEAVGLLSADPRINRYFGIHSGIYDLLEISFENNQRTATPIISAIDSYPTMFRDDFQLPIYSMTEYKRFGFIAFNRDKDRLQQLVDEVHMYNLSAFLITTGYTIREITSIIQNSFQHGGSITEWFTNGKANGSLPRNILEMHKFIQTNPDAFSISLADRFGQIGLGDVIATLFMHTGPKSGPISGSIRDLSYRIPKKGYENFDNRTKDAIFELHIGNSVLLGDIDIKNQIIARVLECLAYEPEKTSKILDLLPEQTKGDILISYFFHKSFELKYRGERIQHRIRGNSNKIGFLRWIESELRRRQLVDEVYLSVGIEAILTISGYDMEYIKTILGNLQSIVGESTINVLLEA